MKNWDKFSETTAKINEQTGNKKSPSIFTYFLVKCVDNGLLLIVVFFTILFAFIGLYSTANNLSCADRFYDLTKLAFGVILGLVAGKNVAK